MKLRIRGNSLRLRLTKTEVADLASIGFIEERTQLGATPDSALVYRLELSETVSQPTTTFHGSCICIQLPAAEGRTWAYSNTVGVYGKEPWGLKLALEKDFKCLDPRRDEDESDAFEHPGGVAHVTCGTEED